MSPLYTYLVARAESVVPAATFHGVFNAVGFAGFPGTDGAVLRELVASPGGVVGVAVFGLVALAIGAAGTPKLTRESVEGGRADPDERRGTEAVAPAGASASGEP